VKGQSLRLRPPGRRTPGFDHVIRGYADGRRVYLVPRHDGEVVVGATVEERDDHLATAGAVLELLRSALDLMPELSRYQLAETCVRHRPATPDQAPFLGPLHDRPEVLVAAGHHQNGILLTPLTADLLVRALTETIPPEPLVAFGPARAGTTVRA
jgi:glycine oxidase